MSSEKYISQTITMPDSFGLHSEEYDKMIRSQQELIKKEMNAVYNILNKTNNIVVEGSTGKQIINVNKNNIWFANNVFFYFSMGRIFDKFDSQMLQELKNYFTPKSNNTFLINRYEVSNFTTDRTKKLENNIGVTNGNYHLLLIIIVYAKEEDLKDAPELAFRERGIINMYNDIREIRDIMQSYMEKYFLSSYIEPTSRINPDPIGVNDNKSMLDVKYDLNSEFNIDSPENRQIYSDLKNRNDRDKDFATRQYMRNDSRLTPGIPEPKMKRNNNPLNKRVYETSASTTIPSNEVGVYDRTYDKILPTMQNEYKLFGNSENDDNYITYKNPDNSTVKLNVLNPMNGLGERDEIQIPSFNVPLNAERSPDGSMMANYTCFVKNDIENIC